MSTDGVLGAVYLPTDGWLDPSGLALALAAGARAAGRQIRTHTRVVGIGGRARPGDRRHRRARAASGPRSPPTSSSTPAACSRRRSAGWPASTSRSSRWPTNISSRSRSRASIRGCRSSATRTISCTSAKRSAGCAWAATSATRRRGRSTASRRLQREAARARLAAVRRDHGRRRPARPGDRATRGVSRMINGPEGFTPDNEFILGE